MIPLFQNRKLQCSTFHTRKMNDTLGECLVYTMFRIVTSLIIKLTAANYHHVGLTDNTLKHSNSPPRPIPRSQSRCGVGAEYVSQL